MLWIFIDYSTFSPLIKDPHKLKVKTVPIMTMKVFENNEIPSILSLRHATTNYFVNVNKNADFIIFVCFIVVNLGKKIFSEIFTQVPAFE